MFLFAVRVIGWACTAKGFAEMHRLRTLGAGGHIGEIDTHHFGLARAGLDEAQLGMGLIGQDLCLVQIPAPAILVGQVDDVTREEGICGDDFGSKVAGHGEAS